jgi:hypothetical protein
MSAVLGRVFQSRYPYHRAISRISRRPKTEPEEAFVSALRQLPSGSALVDSRKRPDIVTPEIRVVYVDDDPSVTQSLIRNRSAVKAVRHSRGSPVPTVRFWPPWSHRCTEPRRWL